MAETELVDLTTHEQRWLGGDPDAKLLVEVVHRMKLVTPMMAFARRPSLIVKAACYVAVETARRTHGAAGALAAVQAAIGQVKDAALTDPIIE